MCLKKTYKDSSTKWMNFLTIEVKFYTVAFFFLDKKFEIEVGVLPPNDERGETRILGWDVFRNFRSLIDPENRTLSCLMEYDPLNSNADDDDEDAFQPPDDDDGDDGDTALYLSLVTKDEMMQNLKGENRKRELAKREKEEEEDSGSAIDVDEVFIFSDLPDESDDDEDFVLPDDVDEDED